VIEVVEGLGVLVFAGAALKAPVRFERDNLLEPSDLYVFETLARGEAICACVRRYLANALSEEPALKRAKRFRPTLFVESGGIFCNQTRPAQVLLSVAWSIDGMT